MCIHINFNSKLSPNYMWESLRGRKKVVFIFFSDSDVNSDPLSLYFSIFPPSFLLWNFPPGWCLSRFEKKQYPHLFLTCSRKRGKKIEVLILFRFCLFYRRLADGSVGALQRYLSAADCDATIQQRRSAHNIGRFWPVSTSRQHRIDAGSALLRRTDGPFIADLLHMELFAAVVLVRLQQ